VLTQSLRALAPYLAWDPVIYVLLAALGLWAFSSALMFQRATARVRRAVRAAERNLGPDDDPVVFTARYEQVSADLALDPIVGPGWRGLRQGLIVPSEAGRPVVSTTDMRDWFHLSELYRAAGGDLRYHAALPGLLVGAGLLVTFLGLSAALSLAGEVVAEGVSQSVRNTALRDLLGAASVKFLTSLAGLGLSILYALFRKRQLKSVETAVGSFVAALQTRMPLKTPATLQAEANIILAKQYTDVQRIGTDFFVNLGSVLETKFSAGLEEHIGPLTDAIGRLASRMENQNEDALQTMLQAFLVKLEGAVGESMRGTAATLDALGQRLDGLQGAMEGAAQQMGRASEDMTQRLGKGTETALAGISAQMTAMVDGLRQAADEAGRSNREAGDDMARQMRASSEALSAAVTEFQERLQDGAASGVARLEAPIATLVQQLRDMGEAQRVAGQESTRSLAETIGRAATSLENTAASVSATLGGGAEDASRRLVEATEAMRDDLRGVLDRFGTTLEASGTALTAGAAAGGEVLRGAAAAWGEEFADASAQLRVAGEAAGAALREGEEDARSRIVEAGRFLEQNGESLGLRLAGIERAASEMEQHSVSLGAALQSATAPVGIAANHMREAAHSALTAIEPWRDGADALRRSVSAYVDAADAINRAQTGSEELIRQLSASAQSFAGVDASLAKTLAALTNGLDSYHRQIADFHSKMDGGLQRSVESLTGVAMSLEGMVEDLTERPPQARRLEPQR
jgi:hypothetical protein